jgi:hypothetical protein
MPSRLCEKEGQHQSDFTHHVMRAGVTYKKSLVRLENVNMGIELIFRLCNLR